MSGIAFLIARLSTVFIRYRGIAIGDLPGKRRRVEFAIRPSGRSYLPNLRTPLRLVPMCFGTFGDGKSGIGTRARLAHLVELLQFSFIIDDGIRLHRMSANHAAHWCSNFYIH